MIILQAHGRRRPSVLMSAHKTRFLCQTGPSTPEQSDEPTTSHDERYTLASHAIIDARGSMDCSAALRTEFLVGSSPTHPRKPLCCTSNRTLGRWLRRSTTGLRSRQFPLDGAQQPHPGGSPRRPSHRRRSAQAQVCRPMAARLPATWQPDPGLHRDSRRARWCLHRHPAPRQIRYRRS